MNQELKKELLEFWQSEERDYLIEYFLDFEAADCLIEEPTTFEEFLDLISDFSNKKIANILKNFKNDK
jgi:hypothetical protein